MLQHAHLTAISGRSGIVSHLNWVQLPALLCVLKGHGSQTISPRKAAHHDCRKLKITA